MQTKAPLITPVLIAGSVILMLGFAIRASFGVFQIPVAAEFGWARSEFSLAIAIQNLAWGIGQPIFGMLAERFGDRRAIVGRAASAENRSMALGIGTAAGSAGQVIGALTAEFLLQYMPWQSVFTVFAAAILLTLFALPFIRSPRLASRQELEESMGQVLVRAFKDPSYTLIFFLQLSACLHHRPLPRLCDRALRPDRPRQHAVGDRHQLNLCLGGKMYDLNGDYTLVWWIGVGVGAFSALVHLPVRKRPLIAQTA